MADTEVYLAEQGDWQDIASFLVGNELSTPYHSVLWLEAIQDAYGHAYKYFVAKSAGQIVGVLPASLFRSPLRRLTYCSVPFCDVGGVVANSATEEGLIIDKALEYLSGDRGRYLELRNHQPLPQEQEDLENAKVRMLLELPEDSEILMQSFSSKLRSQIRKAEKNELIFDCARDAQSIDDFYHAYAVNMHALGSPCHSLDWFQALRNQYKEKLLVGRVWLNNNCIAAGVLLFDTKLAIVPWASAIREHNRLAPNMLLYWNLLRVSCELGCKRFDFGRSTYGEGTYRFKKQWGAKPAPLDWIIVDGTGRKENAGSGSPGRARVIAEKIWRQLPQRVATAAGPRIRRYLSL